MVQVENLLALLDPSFDGLPAIVVPEPGWEVKGDRVISEVEQGAVLAGFAGVEALQDYIQRVGAAFELRSAPGDQFGIRSHPHPGSLIVHLLPQIGYHPVAVRFGVNLIAHLDQQRHVLVTAKTGIQAKLGCDRFGIGGIVLFKARQALPKQVQPRPLRQVEERQVCRCLDMIIFRSAPDCPAAKVSADGK